MIDKEYYNMIFKRKSFRRFNEKLSLSEEEIEDIHKKIKELKPLINSIEIKYKIVKREETTCKRGEYCLLIYSEEKENFLLNVGYVFGQLDLYLASKDIGACWYGMGKTKEDKYEDLNFVIMMAIGKAKDNEFRKDYRKAKRKETEEIWEGISGAEVIADVVKYTPSACNTQPWKVICENNKLKVYRRTNIKSIMPKDKVPFYNSIDMGIFLLFIEISLSNENISFNREFSKEDNELDLIYIATYNLI